MGKPKSNRDKTLIQWALDLTISIVPKLDKSEVIDFFKEAVKALRDAAK